MRLKTLLAGIGLLIILGSLIMPNSLLEKIPGIEFLSSDGSLGMGTASAADVSANTIGTSTNASATLNPNQRAVCYAKSRFWVFYSDGTNLVVRSSLAGSSWSSATTIYSGCDNGTEFSIWLSSSGDNVSIAWASGALNTALKYANYVLTDAGEITSSNGWVNAVAADAGKTYYRPYVSQDVNSKPVISYTNYDGADYTPYCTRSTTADGTWTADFNTQLSTTSDATWATTVLPYGSSLMAIYARDTTTIRSKVYSGSWGTENATTSAIEFGEGFSAVATSDNAVHLVWEYADDDILYSHYHVSGTAWEVEEEVYVGSSATKAPVLSKTLDDGLYCFWVGDPVTDNICYKGYSGGTWDTSVTHWQDESGITDNASITCAYAQTTCGYIPVVWMTGSGSPYNVRFAALERELEPWLSGYLERDALSVGAAAPTTRTAFVDVTLSKDNFIRSLAGQTDLNFGAETYFYLFPVTNNIARATLECDMAAAVAALPSGYTLTKAMLYVNYYSYTLVDPSTKAIDVKELTQAFPEGTGTVASPTDDGSEWNTYDGTNAWPGGVGAMGDTAGSAVTIDGGALGSYGWKTWTITTIAQDAITNHSSVCKLLMYYQTENTATNHLAYFYSKNHATVANRPYIRLFYTYTPGSGDVLDDKVVANIYKGSKTVEDCVPAITVNGQDFDNRIAFTVQTFSEITANTYPLRLVVDTASLVTGGFFAGSASGNATTVEFATDNGSDDMPYWVPETTSAGVSMPKKFNTTGTVFYATPQTTLSANTTYSFYMYVDADAPVSSNYDPDAMVGASGFFEHFTQDATDIADFLSKYNGVGDNDWDQDPAADAPIVTVANSILNLDGGTNAVWEGIASAFTIQNYRALFGCQAKPSAAYGTIGMIDSGGIGGAGKDGIMLSNIAVGQEWVTYENNVADIASNPLWSTDGPFITYMEKYGAHYRRGLIMDDPGTIPQPDSAGITNTDPVIACPTTDVVNKIFIATYNQADVDVDWIAVFAEVKDPPIVTVSDITYDKAGTIFCDDQFSSDEVWYHELAFTKADKTTQLYWYIDELAQLTRQPGDAIRVTIAFDAALAANTVLYCYFDCPSAGSPEYLQPREVFNTSTEVYRYDDFTMPTSWENNTEYVLYDRVEGFPTGLRQYLDSGDDAAKTGIYSSNWACQTFTPAENHTIVGVDVKMYRVGAPAGDVTLRITTTDVGTGKPTDNVLCIDTVLATTLTTLTSGTWVPFTFESTANLTASTKYAIVISGVQNVSKYTCWRYDNGNGYADGSYGTSTDSGVSWTLNASYDFLFKEYGTGASSIAYICIGAHNSGDYADFDAAVTAGKWELQWTTDGGSWTKSSVGEPFIGEAPVGNVGGAAGRCWLRWMNVVKWDTNSYYWIGCATRWEFAAGYWPMDYSAYIAHSTSLETPPDVGYSLISPQWRGHGINAWPGSAVVKGGKLYITWVTAWDTDGGFYISYTEDPSDETAWTHNTNGPFVTATWLNANSGGDYPAADAATPPVGPGEIFYDAANTQWYVMVTGVYYSRYGSYVTVSGDPETWDADDHFTYGNLCWDAGAGNHREDSMVIHDTTANIYIWAFTGTAGIYYRTIAEANFPGELGVTDWGAETAFTMGGTMPSDLAATRRSPRLIFDDSGGLLLYHAASSLTEAETYAAKWLPNYIIARKSSTDAIGGTFNVINTGYKYKQATTTGLNISYVTSSSKADGSIICEVQLEGNETTTGCVGTVFRYEDTANNGYFVYYDYNSGASPEVAVRRITGGTPYTIASAAGGDDYAMAKFPSPWLSPGYVGQLKTNFYGDVIEVYLSLWGNEWIKTHTIDLSADTNFPNYWYYTGHYGVGTYLAAAYVNNFSFSDYVADPPEITTAGESSISITVSPDTLSGNWAYLQGAGAATGNLRENTWYTTETALAAPLFTLINDGTDTVDVTISSSANWTGVGKTWTVSSTGTPGNAMIGIWAGLESDSSYGILVKPDSPPNFLVIGLASSVTQDFGLLFYTCTSNGGNVEMEGYILLTAMVHT